jgi:hypothetical protein
MSGDKCFDDYVMKLVNFEEAMDTEDYEDKKKIDTETELHQ